MVPRKKVKGNRRYFILEPIFQDQNSFNRLLNEYVDEDDNNNISLGSQNSKKNKKKDYTSSQKQ